MSETNKWILGIICLAASLYAYKHINQAIEAEPPKISLRQWWGDGVEPTNWTAYLKNSSTVFGNKLIFPHETIDDLSKQLNRTLRFTEALTPDFRYGFNTQELKRIIEYWRDNYLPRWRGREVFMWQFNHFTTDIQGLRMHFLNLMVYDENKIGKRHYPVLLLHGWPSSIREFYPLIHKLHQTDPDKTNPYIFDVVVPSIPGFAWSESTTRAGLGPVQVAVIMRTLMLRLGYQKFFIHGGDLGSLIGSHIATLFPENVLGYHSSFCTAFTGRSLLKGVLNALKPNFLTGHGFDTQFFSRWEVIEHLLEATGYYHLQATKPDTIGAVLSDNPVGLAAYILDVWSSLTNKKYRDKINRGLEDLFNLDSLLDNVMIYYLTNSITTSTRLFAETHSSAQRKLNMDYIPTDVPTGCARFKNDLIHFHDNQLKDKYRNLIHSTYYEEGGHFIALEMVKLLHLDFIQFVEKVDKFSNLV